MYFIDFQDLKYKTIEYEDLNKLLKTKISENMVIAVYHKQNFCGLLYGTNRMYNNLGEIKESIVTDKMYIEKFDWHKAHENIQNIPYNVLPIINSEQKIISFAIRKQNYYAELDRDLEILEKNGILASMEEVFKGKKILCIYGFNQYAYRVYKLINKYHFPICVIGKMWNYFVSNKDNMWEYMDCDRYNMYMQGISTWKIEKDEKLSYMNAMLICDIAFMCYGKAFEMQWQLLRRKQIKTGVCIIPDGSDFLTPEEKYYQKYGINFATIIFNPDYQISKQEHKAFDLVYNIEELEELKKLGKHTDDRGYKYIQAGVPAKVLEQEEKKYRIYVVGPCIVEGQGVCTRNSLLFQIQQRMELDNVQDYQVVGVVIGLTDWVKVIDTLSRLPIRRKDIVIFIHRYSILSQKYLQELDNDVWYASELYNDSTRQTMFGDITIHTNAYGNIKLAEKICEKLLYNKMDNKMDNEYLQKGHWLTEEIEHEVQSQMEEICTDYPCLKTEDKTIGSIVMNCNPFTKGHQYLIEYAAQRVDYLLIFVVEENKSLFEFKDRIQMVKEGTKNLKNVIVLSSGNHILSYKTLPSYFTKEIKKDVTVNASNDLEIFARYVASSLHIVRRYVGEEPKDKVTLQYNKQMKSILKEFGIDVIEIPRLTIDGEIVSASCIRKAIRDGNYKLLHAMLPESTINYITNNQIGEYRDEWID